LLTSLINLAYNTRTFLGIIVGREQKDFYLFDKTFYIAKPPKKDTVPAQLLCNFTGIR